MSLKARYRLILPPPPLTLASVAQILSLFTEVRRKMWQEVDAEANQGISHSYTALLLSNPCDSLSAHSVDVLKYSIHFMNRKRITSDRANLRLYKHSSPSHLML